MNAATRYERCVEGRRMAEAEVERLSRWFQHLREVLPKRNEMRPAGPQSHPSLPVLIACPECSANRADVEGVLDALSWIAAGKTVDEYGEALEQRFSEREEKK